MIGSTPVAERIPMLVAAVVCVAFIGMLLVMGYHEVPDKNKDLLNTLLGILGTAFSMVVMYYFGSSSSSKQKDTTIAAALNGAAPDVPVVAAGPVAVPAVVANPVVQ